MSTLTRKPSLRQPAPPRALARERELSYAPDPYDARSSDLYPAHAPDPYPAPAVPEERSRLYRGRTVDELIPRIVSELGEDAIVIRHHTGLTGGFAGFFQRPFVEIEACRGGGGSQLLDRYDEDDAAPALPGELDDSHEWDEPGEVWATNPFAEALAEAEAAVRAAEPAVPPDLDAALAEALAEAEAAGLPVEPTAPLDYHAPHACAPAEAQAMGLPAEPTALRGDDNATHAAPFAEAQAMGISPEPTDLPGYDATLADTASHIQVGAPDSPAAVAPVSASSQGNAREEIERSLLDVGVGAEFVHELIEGARAHVLPLMPPSTSLAGAVRSALIQRIPISPPLPAAGAAIAFVGAGGSGKSTCCTALVEAYREHSTLPATCTVLTSEPTHPAPAEPAFRGAKGGLLLLDTPALSCADPDAIGALAAQLALVAPDRVVLALPATLGAKPAGQLLEALRPLGACALAITHADATDQLGVAIQAACTFGVAPLYLLEGGGNRGRLTQIDPSGLLDRLLLPR
jgi:flagellar biosynthesis protein FlhF